MSTKIKRELILEGLDCANCAVKIETKLKELDGISNAWVNFANKTLSIETENTVNIDEMINNTYKVVNELEPHITIREKTINKESKKTFILMGLCCANCVTKIEKEVKLIDGVKEANIDFVSKRLTLVVKSKNQVENIKEEAIKVINKIEASVKVVDEEKNKQEVSNNHNEDDDIRENVEKIRLGAGAAIFGIAVAFSFSSWAEFTLYFISYILVGGEVVLKALKNIRRGQVFDENFLMSLATLGAFGIGQYPEGVAVMLFYQIGELFQDLAVNKSRKSITALMDIRPDFANLKINDDIKRVSPEEVNIGDVIIVKPGEKVPLDGKVVEGNSMVDTSALTGESIPREVEESNEILGGFINKNGVLTVEVTKEFGQSTISKILDLVQNASSRKAPTENFITSFARYYTPVVVIIAFLIAVIPPIILQGATFVQWIYRALVFLVISCPCALVISIPLGFFGGIGGASKIGILIKGSNYLEALNYVETVVFDKTGTLTKGIFKVTQIVTKNGLSQEELLEYAAYGEIYSNHPIALSILSAYSKEVNKDEIENYNEISGHGVKGKIKGREVSIGNAKLMNKENIEMDTIEAVGTIVHLAIDGKYSGYIVISDEVKEDSEKAIKSLKEIGIKKTVMLTGDIKSVGESIAKELGLDEVYTELLPDQKVEKLEMLDKQKSTKGKLAFVGDGVNDAPVLARADVGIAMGGLGSDAAVEAADIVIMTDQPSKIASAIKIAKRTRRIVWQNILFAMGIKIIVLILGAGGIATMWEAVFADVGVTLLAVFNSMRIMSEKGQ